MRQKKAYLIVPQVSLVRETGKGIVYVGKFLITL